MPARTVVLTALVASCVTSLVTLAVAAVIFAHTSHAQANPQGPIPLIRAQRIELVGSDGAPRARLEVRRVPNVGEEYAVLMLMDGSGGQPVYLEGNSRGGGILLNDGHNNTRVNIGALTLGNGADLHAGLWVLDEAQNPRNEVGIGLNPNYSVNVWDADKHVVWQAP